MCCKKVNHIFVRKCEDGHSILLLAFHIQVNIYTLEFSVYSDPDDDNVVCQIFSVNATYGNVDL
jgi:hypothetical protein